MSESEKQDQQEEPKIVVDSDWKEQVAREKEAAEEASRDESDLTEPEESAESEPVTADSSSDAKELPTPPPATFEVLISMLFTQAMSMLGQMPDPSTGKATVNKPLAKHYIDTLDMLGEKTAGNLNDDETKMLSEALHALRMMYVNAKAE